jgi:hypothetical protein
MEQQEGQRLGTEDKPVSKDDIYPFSSYSQVRLSPSEYVVPAG